MKNFKIQKILENRNNLSNLLNNTLSEPVGSSFLTFFSSHKLRVINKKEESLRHTSKFYYQIVVGKETSFINLEVTADHLINVKVLYKHQEHKQQARQLGIIFTFLKGLYGV